MKSSEILELVRAGYTKAEIDAMDGDAAKIEHPNEPEAKPTKVSKEEEKQTKVETEPEAEPEADPEPKQETETEKLVKALGLKFDTLISAVQAKNINNLEQGTPSVSTDDILAKIIDPNYGGTK